MSQSKQQSKKTKSGKKAIKLNIKKKNIKIQREPSESYSVEHFSNNIIKSETINSFLNDGTNLVKKQSLPESSFAALSKYFSKILHKNFKFRTLNRYRQLELNHITIEEQRKQSQFLQSSDNSILTFAIKYTNNLFDALSIALDRDISKSDILDIEEILNKTFLENYSSNVLDGNIPDIVIPEKLNTHYSLPVTVIKKLIFFYKDLLNILADNLRVNILFYIPISKTSLENIETFYLSDFKKEYETIGIKIVIPYANKIKIPDKRSLITKIYYENLFELNSSNNTIKTKFSEIIVSKIRGEFQIDYSIDTNLKIGDQIFFNPLDREGLLRVIEIQITPTLKKRFLLGKSGNLYEDDDDANDLVGNIVINDKSTYDSTVFWSEGYIEQLTSN